MALTWVNVVGDTGIEPVASSVSRKRSPTELIARGGGGNRTRVQGFAGPCLSHSATPPELPLGPSYDTSATPEGVYRADDGIRTRDPHLGKVMLYQLSHVRVLARPGFSTRSLLTGRTVAESRAKVQTRGTCRRPRTVIGMPPPPHEGRVRLW